MKRFDVEHDSACCDECNCTASMVEHPTGDYVLYDDVALLILDLVYMRDTINRMTREITN